MPWPRVLASPRRRERLAWGGAIALVVGGLLAGAVILDMRTSGPRFVPPTTRGPADDRTSETVKPIVVTPAVRREVGAVVDRFARTALVRRNVAAAWEIASSEMRAGVSRAEWNRGELPVTPYPAKHFAGSQWRLEFVNGRSLGIDVTVVPKPRSGGKLVSYVAQVTAHESGDRRRWLVDYWYQRQVLGTEAAEDAPAAGERERGGKRPEPVLAFEKSRISAKWLLLPVGIFALILLLPAFLVARGAYRARRAERLHAQSRRR